MIIDYSTTIDCGCGLMLGLWVTTRRRRYMERLDWLFEGRADTTTVLISFKILLRSILECLIRAESANCIIQTTDWDLWRTEWGVVLKLQSCLLLVLSNRVGHDIVRRSDVVVLHGACRSFQLTYHGGFIVSGLIVCVILLELISWGKGKWTGLWTSDSSDTGRICQLNFILILFRVVLRLRLLIKLGLIL